MGIISFWTDFFTVQRLTANILQFYVAQLIKLPFPVDYGPEVYVDITPVEMVLPTHRPTKSKRDMTVEYLESVRKLNEHDGPRAVGGKVTTSCRATLASPCNRNLGVLSLGLCDCTNHRFLFYRHNVRNTGYNTPSGSEKWIPPMANEIQGKLFKSNRKFNIQSPDNDSFLPWYKTQLLFFATCPS